MRMMTESPYGHGVRSVYGNHNMSRCLKYVCIAPCARLCGAEGASTRHDHNTNTTRKQRATSPVAARSPKQADITPHEAHRDAYSPPPDASHSSPVHATNHRHLLAGNGDACGSSASGYAKAGSAASSVVAARRP